MAQPLQAGIMLECIRSVSNQGINGTCLPVNALFESLLMQFQLDRTVTVCHVWEPTLAAIQCA